MSVGVRVVSAVLTVGLLFAVGGTGAATPLGLPLVCTARGPLYVSDANEVRFSADGTCGLFDVTINDFLHSHFGPFSYPNWTGGCGYGPGPFPPLYLEMTVTGPSGVVEYLPTYWTLPDLVIGDNRFVAPYSATRVLIHELVVIGGHPTFRVVGGTIGQGALFTRIAGSCDVSNPKTANATLVFVLYGDVLTSV